MKIRLDSYGDLPLNKMLCFSVLDITIESVFQIEIEYYQQVPIKKCENISVSINFYSTYKCEKSNK